MSTSLYVETSALLRVVLEGDEGLRPLLLGGGRFTSAVTFAEAARAILRARREGRLDARGAREARKRVGEFGRSCEIVPVEEGVLDRAGQEFPTEPVRTLDAIHLATVLVLNAAAVDLDVASCDGRVRVNADALGFTVLPATS
jgi:predicted nucleic acid-binding protein